MQKEREMGLNYMLLLLNLIYIVFYCDYWKKEFSLHSIN